MVCIGTQLLLLFITKWKDQLNFTLTRKRLDQPISFIDQYIDVIVVSSVTKPGGNGVLRVFNNANSRILTGKAHFSTWTDRWESRMFLSSAMWLFIERWASRWHISDPHHRRERRVPTVGRRPPTPANLKFIIWVVVIHCCVLFTMKQWVWLDASINNILIAVILQK